MAELLCANSGRERTSCVVYALGWTQHTTGVQMVRSAGILQMLLGNMGRPGGGIMAMRGHSTIQGSTDLATLYDVLPGYLPQPAADVQHETLDSYVERESPPTGYWANFRKFIVSLLKAWYGEAATPANDFCFSWLPRVDADYSQLAYFDRMAKGEVKGYFLWGQNPGGGGPNAGLHRAGLRNLDWLVVADWFETESAVFWKSDPTGPPPADIKTEVFFLPAAAAQEKEGSLTNTQRVLQWHGKAIDPLGDSRSDGWFIYDLGKRLKALYAGSTDPRDQPLLNLTWDYDFDEQPRLPDGTVSRIEGEPDLEKVLMEINGYRIEARDERQSSPSPHDPRPSSLVAGFSELKDDGTTACGCWIYSGVFPRRAAIGRASARSPTIRCSRNGASPGRKTAGSCTTAPAPLPMASLGPSARSSSGGTKRNAAGWASMSPISKPKSRRTIDQPRAPRAWRAIAGNQPFILKPDGVGWLYAPAVKDGPLPTHYEPIESPLGNLLYPRQTCSPTVRFFEGPLNHVAHAPTTEYPVVATTFRLTEHYLSGPMSRFNSWLNELQPEMFVELSPELAAERGIVHAGWLTVQSARGRIEARAHGDAPPSATPH